MDFISPIFPVASWDPVFLAVGMTVPEASVYHDHCFVFFQHNIGCAGKALVVESEPISKLV